MRSLFSYILPLGGRFMFKPIFSSVEGFHAAIQKSRKNATNQPPPSFSKDLDMVERNVGGAVVWDIRPKGLVDGDVKGTMMYLHGGSFVLDIADEHWNLAKFFAERLQLVVSVVLYPKGPEHKIEETYGMVQPLYEKMVAAATVDKPFYITGDSCGGCLALAVTQLALQDSKPVASRVILISPLLDQSFSNPELRAKSDSDPFLGLVGVEETVRVIAPDLDPKTDIRLSPMYGPVEGLPPVLLLAAENDMFTADAKKWEEKTSQKADVTMFVGEGMVHCWPIIDFYEGRMAKDMMATWITTPRPTR